MEEKSVVYENVINKFAIWGGRVLEMSDRIGRHGGEKRGLRKCNKYICKYPYNRPNKIIHLQNVKK